MFISIKLKTAAIILAVILGTVGIFSAFIVQKNADASAGNSRVTVVVDAGHGGHDGGALGINTKTPESEINLAIAKALGEFLESKGIRVVQTRKNSDGLYSIFDRNKKRADMKKRKEIIEKATPDLVISIHQNFYPAAGVSGAQTFYAKGSQRSLLAAEAIQSVLNKTLDGRRKPATDDYYILECSEFPSVLVECGFLSNPSEERLLVSAEYQQKIAYSIFTAVEILLLDGDVPILI